MARPRKEFSPKDIEQIKVLARCHCPDTEIAAFMECGERTIQRRFGALLKESREAGKANIRATQFKLAIGQKAGPNQKEIPPNVTMLIWLGKQLLGQTDKNPQSLGIKMVATKSGVILLPNGDALECTTEMTEDGSQKKEV